MHLVPFDSIDDGKTLHIYKTVVVTSNSMRITEDETLEGDGMNGSCLKALTFYQPWAQLVALGVKTIETRSWSTKYRGPLAIHAGSSNEHTGGKCLDARCHGVALATASRSMNHARLPLGSVVAKCYLVDVLPIETHFDGHDCLVVDGSGSLSLVSTCEPWPDESRAFMTSDVSDQLRYGDFTPGGFAWIFEEIKPIDPIPAKGRQGLWNWTDGVA